MALAGFYRPAEKFYGVIYVCDAGYYSVGGQTACEVCAGGTSSSMGSSVCIAAPSGQPTWQPTGHPTRQPTGQPSRQPTGQPSRQPTTQPSSVMECSIGGYVASGVCSLVPAGNVVCMMCVLY